MIINPSNIFTCFDTNTVGTAAKNTATLWRCLDDAIRAHDISKDRAPGQHFLMLHNDVINYVRAGVGLRTQNPDDYHARTWRGEVGLFLKASHALQPEKVAAIVYTLAAYLADPEVSAEERARHEKAKSTHVLVAVLAFAGPEAPLGTDRFISNLAGGNNEALAWTADEIRAKAEAIKAYWSKYAVVAD